MTSKLTVAIAIVVVIIVVLAGIVYFVVSSNQKALSEWGIIDYGSFSLDRSSNKVTVEGSYDELELLPGSGWNGFYLVSDTLNSGDLSVSVGITIDHAEGGNMSIGIGLAIPFTTYPDTNYLFWGQHSSGPVNSASFLHLKTSWDDGYYVMDESTIQTGVRRTYAISVEDGIADIYLDGEVVDHISWGFQTYYAYLHVGLSSSSEVIVEFSNPRVGIPQNP